MNFKWSEINKPVFVLAPMANITTMPFRSICKEFGADIVFTPMLSSNAVVYNPIETLKIAKFNTNEQPVIVQIFGYSGKLIAEAAKIVDKELKPAGIDINMGCPAPKITGNECGSALLKDFNKALDIVKEVRSSYDGQLSVKLRLGWDKSDVIDFAKKLENIGIDAITIHGRTTKQGYSGQANWDEIYKIAKNIKIPVIGNGDVFSWNEAYERLDNSNLAGIMIGRGSLNRPWIFKEIKEKETITFNKSEIAELLEKQTKMHINYLENEEAAVKEMRKFYGWYLKGFPGAGELRKIAMAANSLEDIKNVLNILRTF